MARQYRPRPIAPAGQTIWEAISTADKLTLGARNGTAFGDGVQFDITESERVNQVVIKLDLDGTYRLELRNRVGRVHPKTGVTNYTAHLVTEKHGLALRDVMPLIVAEAKIIVA